MMEEEELKRAFAIMIAQGLNPQPLEEDIVEFDNAAQCGDFTGIGDRMVTMKIMTGILGEIR